MDMIDLAVQELRDAAAEIRRLSAEVSRLKSQDEVLQAFISALSPRRETCGQKSTTLADALERRAEMFAGNKRFEIMAAHLDSQIVEGLIPLKRPRKTK